jgi:hypothetical protein
MGEVLWMTDFPPPPGFEGWQKGVPGEFGYHRECTPHEAELLETNEAAAEAEEQTEDEALRDAWFEALRAQLDTPSNVALNPVKCSPPS